MFSFVSWSTYWSVLTGVSIFYYAGLILIYYRKDVLMLINRPRSFDSREDAVSTQISAGNGDSTSDVSIIESMADEVGHFLSQAAANGVSKNELMFGLKQIVKKYPSLQLSSYRPELEQMISFECQTKCAISLNEEEIQQVWLVR